MKERQLTVLIAAQRPEDRAALREILSRDPSAHYAVIEAEDGFRALELRRARKPDCVILDHDLPDLSVLDVLKKLVAEDESPACAIIVLVGPGDTRLAVEAMKSGAHDCIEKNRAVGEEALHAVSRAIEKVERRRRGAGHESMTVGAARRVAEAAATGSATGSCPERVDHKRAEEQLRLLKTAIEQSNESIVITTSQLDWPGPQIVYVNPAFTKMTGYSFEEVIGKTPRILQGPKTDRAMLDRLRKNCEEGRSFFGEAINYRKDGSEFYLEWSIGPVRNERGEVTHFVATQRDVTERKRIEEELRRSDGEFRSLFELSTIGMAQVSRDYKFFRVNRKFCQMLGYSEQELLQLTFLDVTHPDDREISAAQASACFAGEIAESHFEKRYVRKDGEVIWAMINWALIPDAEGRPLRTVTGVQDITARKHAEEALRESESRLRQLADAMPQIVYTSGPDGMIDYVNQQWYEYSGVFDGQDITEAWFETVHPDDGDRAYQQWMESVSTGRRFEAEYRLRRKDGQYRWHLCRAISIRDREGRIIKWIGTSTDVHDYKQAEEARRKSEEQARRQLAYINAIYATAPVGLCFVDTDLRCLSVNKRLAEINGRSVEEHMGRTVREIAPKVADTVEPILRRVIETGEPALNVEQRVATAREQCALRHFIVSYYPIKNGVDSLFGVNVVVMEITERKKIEEELERLLREEKAARAEAEAANRMKDEFLAIISHELRTPLTSILGWARMLTGGGLIGPQARHALDVIAQSAESQTRLIEDILDTSRIITGRFTLDVKPVEIEHVFRAAVDVIRPSAEAKRIDLSEVVESPSGVVLGDAKRLQQAIWNLLSNAVKFTNEGGRIEARLGRGEGQIEVAVTDTGIGIEPRFLPHVFDRFRQADASSTREYGGLGIGLAIVRHIVEMHGGGVSASSPGKGQGATFKISLPPISGARLTQPEGPRAAAPPPKELRGLEDGHRLDGVRVLIVEDDYDTLDMLKFIFVESGAEVIAATTVDEALDALERFGPDALVSDIAMPDRNGYDLIHEVRSREAQRGGKIPAVAVTAYARAEDRMRVLAAGFQMHIAKPIAPDELIAVVASLTGRIQY
jgi:PAS domain S-box-containing protein